MGFSSQDAQNEREAVPTQRESKVKRGYGFDLDSDAELCASGLGLHHNRAARASLRSRGPSSLHIHVAYALVTSNARGCESRSFSA